MMTDYYDDWKDNELEGILYGLAKTNPDRYSR